MTRISKKAFYGGQSSERRPHYCERTQKSKKVEVNNIYVRKKGYYNDVGEPASKKCGRRGRSLKVIKQVEGTGNRTTMKVPGEKARRNEDDSEQYPYAQAEYEVESVTEEDEDGIGTSGARRRVRTWSSRSFSFSGRGCRLRCPRRDFSGYSHLILRRAHWLDKRGEEEVSAKLIGENNEADDDGKSRC